MGAIRRWVAEASVLAVVSVFAGVLGLPLESLQVIQVVHDLSPISGTRCSRGNKRI